MSGPSALHEDRVLVLQDLADLAGYVLDAQLAASPRPDVVRLHCSAPALFVADAKATETPGNVETRTRLLGYLGATSPWLSVGFDVRFAICHGPDPHRTWASSVERLAALLGLAVPHVDLRKLDQNAWVSWMTVVGTK